MCKHILFNNFDKSKDIETLARFTEMSRENDGFGAIIRRKDKSINTLKGINQGSFYIHLMQCLDDSVDTLVVHHRTSTNGHGVDYAHPFEYQGNFLTHNGVVSVPDKHDTKTTNDSEALLHHLIKSGYDTMSIQGYFSCFILNHDDTVILVDDIAPIYTDGRIYSSHQIDKSWQKVTLQKIVIGESCEPIQVSKSNYGQDKAYLSLGSSPSWYADNYTVTNLDDFLYFLSSQDEFEIMSAKNKKSMIQIIKEKASFYAVELEPSEIEELVEMFNYESEKFYNY